MLKYLTEQEWKKKYIEYFHQFTQFLDENSIKYSLAFGSMIGAVREHKMIDWDFDFDLYIENTELEKLEKISDKLPQPFRFVNFRKNDSLKFGESRIYIDGFMILYKKWFAPAHIDFFEYMSVSKNSKEKFYKLRNKYVRDAELFKKESGFKYYLKRIRNKIFYYNKLNFYYWTKIRKIYKPGSVNTVCLSHGNIHTDFSSNLILVEFNKKNSLVLENYDEILKELYGDYMKPKTNGEISLSENYHFFESI